MSDLDAINADKILTRYDILADAKDKPETIAERILPKDPVLRKVAEDVVFLKAKNIIDDTTEALKTKTAEDIIEGGLLKGMDVVAELYGRGIYYLPHVMVASDAMDKGIKIAEKSLTGARKLKGTVVMHAAEGDPHDIGKNIAAVLLKSNGYGVVDLGRDVLVDNVVKAVEEHKPIVVTGTALMTTTMSAFPKVTERLAEKGINIPFIGAGGAVNRSYVESFPMGIYAEKAANGPGLVEKAAAGWDWRKIRDNWDAIQAKKI
ncbi:B12-binding domain-containing protein [Methanomassiliicoccus luminyensis]|jgi:methanol corrinoid protein|uniref:B12-binding domain-containing protein n=1 Tax=Methanomassiliicoccus luminyensis TaxID=1080712 RepID=UPI00037B528E|nr:B12-binding domain-containing protein [Methanomassiliicoccus luminyensis]